MLKIEKKLITLSFDKDSLQEFRKILFQNGLSPQEFFAFIMERVSNMDPRLNEFLEEAGNFKKESLEERKNYKKVDAEAIYKAIEEKLKDKRDSTK